jgi:hypothetical protein
MKSHSYGIQVVLEEICIDIESHRGTGVAEHPLHRLDVRSG